MSLNFKIHTIDIAKLLITVLIVYEQWFLYKYGPIPNLLQILAVLIVIVTVFSSFSLFLKMTKGKTFVFWLLFGITSLINSVLFSGYTTHAISSLTTYFSFLIVCLFAGTVSMHYRNRIWFQNAIILVCLLCAYSTLTAPFYYRNEGYLVITMSSLNNPNNLGFMMSIGIFALMLPEKTVNGINWMIRLALSVVFLYVIINTGSRSSLLSSTAVIALSLYFNYRYETEKGTRKTIKRFTIFIFIIIGIIVGIHIVTQSSGTRNGISRLFERFSRVAFTDRGSLYIAAWKVFKQYFLFGVGYDCFSIYSGEGLFTHSTYMELLSCTGIVGAILFLTPVVSGIKDAVKSVKNDRGNKLTVLLMMAISGLFGITYYTFVFMMTLYLYLLPIKIESEAVINE